MSTETKALAQRMAAILREDNVELLERVVEIAGPEKSAKILKKAAELFKAGVKTYNKSRARTMGGCYFYVARQKLSRTERLQAGLYSHQEKLALNSLAQHGLTPEQAVGYLVKQSQTLTKKELTELMGKLAKGQPVVALDSQK